MGEEVLDLPWLSPCAASLTALARQPLSAAWPKVRTDPGVLLLLVRHAFPQQLPLEVRSLFPLIREEQALHAAWMQLQKIRTAPDERPCFVDWNQPSVRFVYQSCLKYAHLAHRLAKESRRADADLAWTAGLLAPLGWLVLCAAAPAKVEAYLQESRLADYPAALQQKHFGLEAAALARRLHQNWRLPDWLRPFTGSLGLPSKMARAMGTDEELFRLVQLAAALIEQREPGLRLSRTDDLAGTLDAWQLDKEKVKTWCDEALALDMAGVTWEEPAQQALLPDLLEMALENRRLRARASEERLQQDIDVLHAALEDVEAAQAEQLHNSKMNALAEFAAGAAHEINNPLAVISGQAQYLLVRESEPGRRQSLQKIMGQTQRVHSILTEVLQFARPAPPRKQLIDIAALIREVAAALQGLADECKVRLICPPPAALTLYADPAQIAKALTCLVRNAIEAAPEEGWVNVRAEQPQAGMLHLIVEDNGKGPPVDDASRLFDPFYSGRQAGRGRGLGLPVAWRLARLHGGDVVLASKGNGPTRFILRLPLPPVPETNGHKNGSAAESFFPPHRACSVEG